MKHTLTFRALSFLAGTALVLFVGCNKKQKPVASAALGPPDEGPPPIPLTGVIGGVRDFANLQAQLSAGLSVSPTTPAVLAVWNQVSQTTYQSTNDARTPAQEMSRQKLVGAYCLASYNDAAGATGGGFRASIFTGINLASVSLPDVTTLANAMGPVFSPRLPPTPDEISLVFEGMKTVSATDMKAAWVSGCIMFAGGAEAGEL